MRNYIFLGILTVVGCKTTENKPDDTAVTDSNSVTDTGDSTDTDTDTTDTNTDTGTTDTDTVCWVAWEAGTCWDCDLPTTPEADSLKFLNQCSDVSYADFDNAARIPSSTWVPGTPLPSL
jgi:hypothetical protein